STVRKAEVSLPIVARGEFSPEQAIEMMVSGASGIAVSSAIAYAADPVEATTLLIEALQAVK
ncbi:MAG: thiamine phosphate synthase, partial [Muribaculaceae bacterium]|nr:thiamine phosphate synthase [Muribaculaceae bacterium]